MIVIDNGDAIRGIAEVIEKLDFTVNGYVGTTATQLADGQMHNAEADLYASSADATVVTSITIVNTDSVARTFTLYLKPSAGTSRAITPVSLDLPQSYSFYTDGQRAVVMSTGGEVVQTYSLHAASHTDGTDDIQDAAGDGSTKGISTFDAQHFTLTSGVVDLNIDDTPANGETDEPITSNWAYGHSVDLDAHTINLYEQFVVGQFLPLPLVYTAYDLTMVQYKLYAIYIIVPRNMTFDRIAIDIETLDNGKDIRLGIYNCDSDLAPSSLVQDCGTVDTDSTGSKAITLDPAVSLTKGRYFLAAITDSDGVVKVVNAIPYSGGLGLSSNFDRAKSGWYATRSATEFAALADPFGAASIYDASSVIGLRIESLD